MDYMTNKLKQIGLPDETGMANGEVCTDPTAAALYLRSVPLQMSPPCKRFQPLLNNWAWPQYM